MLIVIVVIGILLSAILVAGSGLVNKGRTSNTQAVLTVVAEAVEQFKRDQSAKPTIASASQGKPAGAGDPNKLKIAYTDRYGPYPPDEIEVFTARGLPGSNPPGAAGQSLAPGRAQVVTAGGALPLTPMQYYSQADPAANLAEHRDMLALVVAIETLSDTASSILDRIPDRNRTPGALEPDGDPAVFLDRNNDLKWDAGDLQIRHIVDDWGVPINYMAQRDWKDESGYKPIESSNHSAWNEASTEIIRLNGGSPVLFSWGPNGKDQLTKDAMGNDAKASLVGDFEEEPRHGVIDNPLNDDNVYANPAMREKLAKGPAQP
jgi:type II secretory pathway pseudopilin PulG